ARCRQRKYRLDEESESIVKPEALEEAQPPLDDGKLNVVHQDRLSPGYCLSQTASIPTGRVIHQRIVDDDHSISSSSSRVYDGPRSEEHTSELQSRENLVCRLR